MVARHPAGASSEVINESWITCAGLPGGPETGSRQDLAGPTWGAASVPDADPSALLPDDRDGFLGAAVEEDEALGNGAGAGNFQAGSSRRQIDDVAVDDRGPGIGNDLGSPRHQAG